MDEIEHEESNQAVNPGYRNHFDPATPALILKLDNHKHSEVKQLAEDLWNTIPPDYKTAKLHAEAQMVRQLDKDIE